MNDIWIVLLVVLGIASSLYAQSRKTEKAKKERKDIPQTTKPKSIFDTIFSELDEDEDYYDTKEKTTIYPEKVRFKENKNEYTSSIFLEDRSKNEIEKIEVQNIEDDQQDIRKPFDLREAVINSAILYRQYN